MTEKCKTCGGDLDCIHEPKCSECSSCASKRQELEYKAFCEERGFNP